MRHTILIQIAALLIPGLAQAAVEVTEDSPRVRRPASTTVITPTGVRKGAAPAPGLRPNPTLQDSQTGSDAPPAWRSAPAASTDEDKVSGDFRRWNIRYQVPGILVNSHTAELDFTVVPKWRVSLLGNYTRQISNGEVSLEYVRRYLGFGGHFFLQGDADRNGLYVKGAMNFVQARGRVQDLSKSYLTRNESGVALAFALVYQFMTEGGLNLHVGVGFESRNYPDRAEYQRTGSGEQVQLKTTNNFPLVGELTLGYAF